MVSFQGILKKVTEIKRPDEPWIRKREIMLLISVLIACFWVYSGFILRDPRPLWIGMAIAGLAVYSLFRAPEPLEEPEEEEEDPDAIPD